MSRKRMLPAVSIVAAIALAIGGALAGYTFGPHTPVDSPTEERTVPVLAPVAVGDASAPGQPSGAGDSLNVSRTIATRTVRMPSNDPAGADPETRDTIRRIVAAPNPDVARMTITDPQPANGTSDDPCAPRSGGAAGECPSGTRSTVLADGHLLDFVATGQAFPPTRAQFNAHGNPFGGSLWCDGLTAGANDVPFGILATAPGIFNIRFWPSAHPDQATDLRSVATTSAATQAAFENAVAHPTGHDDALMVRQCLLLHDLLPDTAYTAEIFGIDIYHRMSPTSTERFNTSGAPVHPGATILTLGEEHVLVGALHPEDQQVQIRAYSSGDPAHPVAECSTADAAVSGASSVHELTAADEWNDPASVDQINGENAPPDFTRRQFASFVVPEGSLILVCARWYQAGTSPSWARVQPLFESSATLQSPDRLEEQLDLSSIDLYRDYISSVTFVVSSAYGQVCDSVTVRTDTDGGNPRSLLPRYVLPITLCQDNGANGTLWSHNDQQHQQSRGESSDLVVWATTTFTNGDTVQSPFTIPGADAGCRGVCTLPLPATFAVPLGTIDRQQGMCDSSQGPCTTPTRGESLGVATIRAIWSQGPQNGRSSWVQSAVTDLAPHFALPTDAQIDQSQGWTFSPPNFPITPTGSLVPPPPGVTASYNLVVDRPVDYTVRFLDTLAPTRGVAVDGCGQTPAPLVVRGHVDGSGVIRMPNACIGHVYTAELELTDAAGHHSTWSQLERPNYWTAIGGIAAVPGIQETAHFSLRSVLSANTVLRDVQLELGGSSVPIDDSDARSCTSPSLRLSNDGTTTAIVTSSGLLVHFELVLAPNALTWESPAQCVNDLREAPRVVIDRVIPLDQIYTLNGVRIDIPSGFTQLSVWLTPR